MTKTVKLITEQIDKIPSLPSSMAYLSLHREYFVLGDFSPTGVCRYSYLGINPCETLVFDSSASGNPFELLDAACGKYRLIPDGPLPVPFVGGWVGYLCYDLGRHIERLPDQVVHDIPLPLLRFGFYDTVLAWDHDKNTGYLLALQYEGQKTNPHRRLNQLRQLYESVPAHPQPSEKSHSPTKHVSTAELAKQMQHNIKPGDYLDKVVRAIEYIKAGDIYEVNLSQRFSCPYSEAPAGLYEYLTAYNPAAYAALLVTPGNAVVSVSPELFLSKRGDHIITRPIKGTIARGENADQDLANRQELEQSQKDRAELNMIIDLERNDLGRICRWGSVKVLEERTIETHPTVFHTVATIAGNLRGGTSVGQILQATFPGGSITGAPKIRAMEIIDELEPTARSVYTGSIGWIGFDGNLELNIAIRTIVLAGQKAHLQVGGAVVAESHPQAEYDETLAKAAALLHGLHATSTRQPIAL